MVEEPAVLRAVTGAVTPKLRVSIGAVVSIAVAAEIPRLPLKVVKAKLPIAPVVIVYGPDAPETMLPELVDKLTACIVPLPSPPLSVIPLAPSELLIVRLETVLPMLSV